MSDTQRLREEYAIRARHLIGSDFYSVFNPTQLFFIQERQRVVLDVLKKNKHSSLSDKQILEVGCGAGGVLAEFVFFGASPENLFGVDLLLDRLIHAGRILSSSHFTNSNGAFLPFESQSFDVVMQFTALSSILDLQLRRAICAEMTRVLRPGGLILSYDFWLNPTNLHTRGLRPAEIRAAFPNCSVELRRITLAPPLARTLVPVSWGLAYFFEKLKIFNSHYLAVIRPSSGK